MNAELLIVEFDNNDVLTASVVGCTIPDALTQVCDEWE